MVKKDTLRKKWIKIRSCNFKQENRRKKLKFKLSTASFFILLSFNHSALAFQDIPDTLLPFTPANGDAIRFTIQDTTTIPGFSPGGIVLVPTGTNIISVGGNSILVFPAVLQPVQPYANVVFAGTSTIAGAVGTVGVPPPAGTMQNSVRLARVVTIGGSNNTVTFNGTTDIERIQYGSSNVILFNADANIGDNISNGLGFSNTQGVAIIGSGVTFTGNTGVALGGDFGTVILNSGSQFIGRIGQDANPIHELILNGNALHTGTLLSNNITLGLNTLTQNGAVTFPPNANLNLTVLSDSQFGRINAAGSPVNFDATPLTVNVTVTPETSLSGSPLEVVTGNQGAGPNPAPVVATSNSPFFIFEAENSAGTGNVLLFPIFQPFVPPGPASSEAFGFGPLANNALAQMSFQALSQFQNQWLANVTKARSANMCSANPCCEYGFFSNNPTPLYPCQSNCQTSNGGPWDGEGLWIDGFGLTARQGTINGISGYNANMQGGVIGLQRPISNTLQLGVSAGYTVTHISGRSRISNSARIETPAATAYLGYTCGSWFLDSFATFAKNYYSTNREIALPGFPTRIADAKFAGSNYGALVSGGYNFFYCNGITFTPLASIQAQLLKLNEFSERGAGGFGVEQQNQTYPLVQSSLGFMLGYQIPCECFTLYSELHTKWLRYLKNYRIRIVSRFLAGGPLLETLGVSPEPNQLNAGASITLFAAGNFAAKGSYEFNCRRTYRSHEGWATVAYKF